MLRLDHAVRRYDWGSVKAIPDLLGLPAGDAPLAEVWLGAHKLAPARVAAGEDDQGVSLSDMIARDPVSAIGQSDQTELPYLLKVLGVAKPLSLQVHPTAEQARAGYAREQAAGVPLDAPERAYRDPNGKPEMVYALTSFEALCGLRPPEQARAVLAPLAEASPLAGAMAKALQAPGRSGLAAALSVALKGAGTKAELVENLAEVCRHHLVQGATDPGAYALVGSLAKRFGGNRGVAAALLMNHVSLAPGEALCITPGTLHAYLRGLAIELMATSDNTLRAGLTSKPVDVSGVIETIDITGRGLCRPSVSRDGPARMLYPPGGGFILADIRLDGTYQCPLIGPRIVLTLFGRVTAFTKSGSMHVSRGQSLFALASDGPIELRGKGRVVMAAPSFPKQIPSRA
ncbi:MAG: mannose-6-phosphate isomerase, class I [Micrococcales bacterium]|nr:mannose-6-phosphate isomerase, class I [Micrococcales bacterium]